ncbi:bifunctional precorrin-2 dehydrogenase/sirohydrochlorin ferrochelatase [Tessaracoccus sp. OS52]|uniref:precorrin-2 dehydrogenase/sirohydrochlorin ferrochelatase family protein n=1 Tax=Tessaracoccus sp. OS52 TaxID=2886691 RepID=UPI001D0FD3BE|nr:bifunctional precorrin-2 dehydrogenase/sirohydrochlorin ferrochelatase [Tessaracoccus sp. OS52]MCC2591959.1 bifunctional precorrin-2 dehydrogenase/sirohydrochlorin ferrochelatase [Tessaracoccus sp. OS52]
MPAADEYALDPDGESGHGSPAYLAGLLLQGRDVLVVGAGAVAERRLERLLEVGARVRVVAPEATDGIAELDSEGLVAWRRRSFVDGDLDGAWYVLAATDSPDVNAAVAAGAEARHTFCVRCDDALGGSAWTPATYNLDDLTVAVIGNRNPQRSKAVREAIRRAIGETA